MQAVLVYITCRDEGEAKGVGEALIESRLAACVNIIDGMRSMFWWGGKIDQDVETVLLAKTRVGLVGKLTDKVKAVHSDECPCVVAVPIIDGNPDFLAWIQSETGAGAE
ncbi:divalent-cation tolerance protein CutA [Desulfovermiculus halophilus]|uniref:divalent-cation tolerance protein CutA n=1 Tax=Desulfovermiculus halophilus TaxID=339722 RepID=UPI000484797A|nr:divalent-cation tolerance protein CutA [Desulfovermiculus halophilus]